MLGLRKTLPFLHELSQTAVSEVLDLQLEQPQDTDSAVKVVDDDSTEENNE